jgi:hypothetical protein
MSVDQYAAYADDLSAIVEHPFTALAPLAAAFADVITVGGTSAALMPLRDVADAVLDDAAEVYGAGVVVTPGVLADEERFLQWRQRQPDGSLDDLLLEVDARGDDPYDYPEMEWFRVPATEGRRMVSGPYFDYLGNERYTLTYAVPVLVSGAFVGIAGCDVIIAQLERSLLPVLRQIPARAALLNHERRVVTANAPSLVTGERVALEELEAGQRFPVTADQGWSLVVLPWPARPSRL